MARARAFGVVVALVAGGLVAPTSAGTAGADAPPPARVVTTFTTAATEGTYVVPKGVSEVRITAVGGHGGGSQGGRGASATGLLAVTPGQVLYAEVGAPGTVQFGPAPMAGGGGAGGNPASHQVCTPLPGGAMDCATTSGPPGYSGGGGSGVQTCSVDPAASCAAPSVAASRLVVAGGGGGQGSADSQGLAAAGHGGDAGTATTAASGTAASVGGSGGAGAALSSEGSGGAGGAGEAGLAGGTGSTGTGGTGGAAVEAGGPGGGGGGGWFGGGGGGGGRGFAGASSGAGGGGGGGSTQWASGRFPVRSAQLTDAAPSVTIQVTRSEIEVDSTADDTTAGDGHCTLREALGNFGGTDTTGGDCGLGVPGTHIGIVATGTITLGSALPVLPPGVQLLGPGAEALTLTTSDPDARLLELDAGTVRVQGITFHQAVNAPAFQAAGDLTLTDCAFTGNRGPFGAGLSVFSGTVTVDRCRFDDNQAAYGGAIQIDPFDDTASLTVRDSSFTNNSSSHQGGAIWAGVTGSGHATLLVQGSVFSGSSSFEGGAIWSGSQGTGTVETTVRDSAIRGNTATSFGSALENATSVDAAGGTAHLLLDRSEVSGNVTENAQSGDVIANRAITGTASLDIVNSTIAGNSTFSNGAIIANQSAGGPALARVFHSLIDDNHAAVSAIRSEPTAPTSEPSSLVLGGNIIGHNLPNEQVRRGGGGDDRVGGTVDFSAPNLFLGNPSGEAVGPNDIVRDVPMRPLADNGGPELAFAGGATRTQLPDDPSILDLASSTSCALTGGVDQRGVTRPQGAACDLGPVEVTTLPPYISSSGLAGRVGEPVAAKIRASGLPPASLTVTGALPAGLTSTQQADGSYLISGTPELGTGAAYPLEATATSTAGTVHTELTLEIAEDWAVVPNRMSFEYGAAGAVPIRTIGYPAPDPNIFLLQPFDDAVSGVTFAGPGDGTGTISGTPGAGSVGDHVAYVEAEPGTVVVIGTVTITVTPAPLTIRASDVTVTYGQTPMFGFTAEGLRNQDTAASALSTQPSCGVDGPHTAVGTYPITCHGAAAHDYTISEAAGTLTVRPADLTITPDAKTASYGQPVAYSWSVSGLTGGDTAAAALTTSPTCGVGLFRPGVGPHPITCSGAVSPNYTVHYGTASLQVTPAPLVIVAEDATRAYGAPNPAFTWHLVGFASGENPTSAGVHGAPVCTSPATPTSPASGSPYPITCTPGTLAAANYSFVPVSMPGRLTVAKAATTLTNGPATTTLLLAHRLSTRLTRGTTPLAGRTVVFTVSGVAVCRSVTDANGTATCGFTGLVLGPATWTTSWAGDADHSATSRTSSF